MPVKKLDPEHKEFGNMPAWTPHKPDEFWKAADMFERTTGRHSPRKLAGMSNSAGLPPQSGLFWCCWVVIRIVDSVSAGRPAETAISSRTAMTFSLPLA